MKTARYFALISLVVATVTFASMGAESLNDAAGFTVGNSYNLSIFNDTALEFPPGSGVADVSSTGNFSTTYLEVYLEHNYNVDLSTSGSAFVLDTGTSDYSSPYAISAEWSLQWAFTEYPGDGSSWSGLQTRTASGPDDAFSESFATNVDETDGDVFGRIKVNAERNGLDDPQGTYGATVTITVSDLSEDPGGFDWDDFWGGGDDDI